MTERVSRWNWGVLVFAAALVYFALRGPLRAVDQTVDLPTFYAGTRAWMLGEDPYDQAATQRIYNQNGGDERVVARCVNPPSFFPLMTPLGAMSYPASEWAMMLVNLTALGVAGWAIGRAAGIFPPEVAPPDARPDAPPEVGAGSLPGVGWLPGARWLPGAGGTSGEGWLPGAGVWWAAIVALAPVQTTISQGQHGLLVTALLGLALLADATRRDVVVGLCLAVAAALKPQMVLLFGFYYLLRGRWGVVATGAATSALLLAIGIGRMELLGIDWLQGLRDNMAAFTSSTERTPDMAGAANYSILGKGRFIMIDIGTLIYGLTAHPLAGAAARLLVGGAAVVVAVFTAPRRIQAPTDLLPTYAILATGCLLSSYNRYYAASSLILVIGLAMWLILARRGRLGWILLALIAPFILPGVAILLRLEAGPLDGSWIVNTWLWNALLYPHQVYLLIAILAASALAGWPNAEDGLRGAGPIAPSSVI